MAHRSGDDSFNSCIVTIHFTEVFIIYSDIYNDFPVNTKLLYNMCTMLDQRRRHGADIVKMLYKCFVFTGLRVQAIF